MCNIMVGFKLTQQNLKLKILKFNYYLKDLIQTEPYIIFFLIIKSQNIIRFILRLKGNVFDE